jgi:hypothetical protein
LERWVLLRAGKTTMDEKALEQGVEKFCRKNHS